jgi:hypothetical protein
MGTRNQYWVLDCIIALTAVALGSAALCSFVGVAMPSLPGPALSVEALLCGVGIVGGLLFAGYVWRDHRYAARGTNIRSLRAHQERHAKMLERASHRAGEVAVAAPESREPGKAPATPETMLATSLTSYKAGRSVRQNGRRTAAVPVVA